MVAETDRDSELYSIKSDVCCGNETGGDQGQGEWRRGSGNKARIWLRAHRQR